MTQRPTLGSRSTTSAAGIHSFHILLATMKNGGATVAWRAVGHRLENYAAFLQALRAGHLDDELKYAYCVSGVVTPVSHMYHGHKWYTRSDAPDGNHHRHR